jgi:hypothetical protein
MGEEGKDLNSMGGGLQPLLEGKKAVQMGVILIDAGCRTILEGSADRGSESPGGRGGDV